MGLLFQINASKATRIDLLVQEVLKNAGHDVSRSVAQGLVEDGKVKINGVLSTKPSAKFLSEITIEIDFIADGAEAGFDLSPIDLGIEVLYDDEDIAVINKPAGLSVHYGAGVKDEYTLVNGLKFLFRENLSDIDPSRLGIVHRLDKDTSGLMIVAKNNPAHEALSDAFKNRSITKKYIAFSWGVPSSFDFWVENFIGRHPKHRQKMAVVRDEEKGKLAISHFRVLQNYKNIASKLECEIETGRTHQIRVHLAYSGYPVIGDQMYTRSRVIGGKEDFFVKFKRQALHSCYLKFLHPSSGEEKEFFLDISADMKGLERILEEV